MGDREEFEKSIDNMGIISENELVEGVVIQIDSDYVYISIGYKSDGRIPVAEFNGNLPKINDKITVFLEKKEGRGGELLLSKTKADEMAYQVVLQEAYKNNSPVYGKIIKAIPNGLEVELGGAIKAFCPASKADINKVDELEKLVNVESGFKILKYEKRKLIVSRRDFLKERADANREKFFASVHEGDVVDGIVKSFTSFGAFIDLGGFDGLLHINDMSWGHVARPKDYVKKGDKIELIVLALDTNDKKINLSLKHFTPDPWLSFSEKFNEGDIVKGKVTKLIDYGAFVEIEQGIEGFVHVSELSWVKRLKNPKEVLSIGDEIEAKILDFDIESQRISLGVKQVLDNPWEKIEENYHVGQIITGPVVKITNSGAFVQLQEGIDGFVHVEDLSWTRKIKNPASILKVGEERSFSVVSIDPQEQRIRLGVKQLSDDPWEVLSTGYGRGSEISGEITSKTDFGLFVKVVGDIEGLINVHQLADADLKGNEDNPEAAMAKYNVGDTIKCAILDINPEKKRLSLSIKALITNQQRNEISKYLQDDGDEEGTATLADFLSN